MILTVGSYKGGTGKTTTAVMLALLLAHEGPTVLVDADRQGSAMTWARLAGSDWPANLSVVPWAEPFSVPPSWGAHVVIDTGPGDPARFRTAVEHSDTVLVTTGARVADAVQVGAMTDVVEKLAAQRPLSWGVLLTLVRLRTRAAASVAESMDSADMPVLHTIVPNLQRYADAYGTVPDRFDAYSDVLRELQGVQ